MWATGQYYPMWWSKDAVRSHSVAHLRLEP